MFRYKLFLLCFVSIPLQSALAIDPVPLGPDQVYVATGEDGYLVRIDLATQTQTLIPLDGIEPGKAVFGPDGKIYLFDPVNGTISSVSAASVSSWSNGDPALNHDEVYPAGATPSLQEPEDGWFDHEGSFYVVDRALGADIYKFPSLATSSPEALETVALGSPVAGAGIAITRSGDLLVLDRANGRVLKKVVIPALFPATDLITGLADPIALERSSPGDIYVADGNRIKRFDIEENSLSECYRFRGRNDVTALQFNKADQLFVTTTGNRGRLWQIDTAGGVCSEALLVAEVEKPGRGGWPAAAGVTFPPTAVSLSKEVDLTQLFNFQSSAFELTVPGPNPCTATVTATQTLPSELDNWIGQTPNPDSTSTDQPNLFPGCTDDPRCARLAIPLGERGFALFHLVESSTCPEETPGYEFLQYLITQFLSNPRSIKCPDTCFTRPLGNTPQVPIPLESCTECELAEFGDPNFEFRGYYPFNVTLAEDDPILRDRGNNFSGFFAADIGLVSDTSAIDKVEFRSPLEDSIRLADFNLEDPPPNLPYFSGGSALPAKFRANDENGDNIEGILALIAVARIWDETEGAVFEAIDVQSTANSNEFDILFRSETNRYIYNLDTTGYLGGVYSLTVTFLGHNTAAVTTFFGIN